MRIVLAGEEAAGVEAMRLVADSPHELRTVLCDGRPDDRSRGRNLATFAREAGVPILPAGRVTDPAFACELRRDRIDVLLNVHSLHIVDPEVLAAPRVGCFNLHPGPLPRYAGLSVPSWAIYEGETTHAVTLHRMAPRVDAGAIAYVAWFPLRPRDTGLTVSVACAREGLPLISRLLEDLHVDPARVPAEPQDPAGRRWFGRGAPHGGWIPWDAGAQRVVDLVRACDYGPWESPWGRPRSVLAGAELTVGRARRTGEPAAETPGTVGRRDGTEAVIATADEWVVVRGLRCGGVPVRPDEVLDSGDVLTVRSAHGQPGRAPITGA